MKTFTRKDFLRFSGAGLGAVGLMALTGCSSSSSTSSSSESTETTTDTTTEETSSSSEEAEVVEEKEYIEFNIAVIKSANSICDDFNEMPAFAAAEPATNVHINWTYVDEGNSDKITALLTADLPDAFLYLLGQDNIASAYDSFMDISPYMTDEYVPNMLASYEELGYDMNNQTWEDGSIRCLPTGCVTNISNDAMGIMMINTEWLDELGMDIPTTTDELYDVLCAFRDNEMGGSNTIPLAMCDSFWCGHVINLANAFGIAGNNNGDVYYYYQQKDGVVSPTLDTQGFRDFLEYTNKLVSEGLLDKESFTSTSAEYTTKIQSGAVGAFMAYSPYAWFDDEETISKYAVVPCIAADGYEFVKSGAQGRLVPKQAGFAITTACSDIERLLDWWDYLSTGDMPYVMAYGEQGGFWDVDADGNHYQKTPDGLSDTFTVENYKYTYGLVDGSTLKETLDIPEDEDSSGYYRIQMTEAVWDYLPTEIMPIHFVSEEKTSERTMIQTELVTYVSAFIANSAVSGIDDSSWDSFVAGLDTYQYYDWIQWWQDYLDGEF